MHSLNQLLRAPAELARRCVEDVDLNELSKVALVCVCGAGALFGATLGSFRGGGQVFYAALKVPVAWLLTLVVCVPAFYALTSVFGRTWSLRSLVALVLAATARAALVLLAFVPVLWLMIDAGASYHATATWAALTYGLSGLAALGVLLRAIGRTGARATLVLSLLVVFFAAGGQAAWLLRPYLGRPSQAHVPFLRMPEDAFLERVWTAGRSSLGLYDGWTSPPPWEELPAGRGEALE